MKDLLADLQVEDGDWSLDQLERELAQLDQEPSQQPSQQQGLPTLDAASLVVMHAKERSASGPETTAPLPPNDGIDAWSLSLEKFTALSLQEDFLAADSERKQQQQKSLGATPKVPTNTFDGAEDYDIAEKPALAPPPGLGAATATPVAEQPKVNSAPVPQAAPIPLMQASRPQPVPMQAHMPPPGVIPPPQGGIIPGISTMPPLVPGVPPPGVVLPMPPPQGTVILPMPPPQGPQAQPPVLMAVPAMGGPAWQNRPAAPAPPPVKAFCNPHPNAPPVPATVLESKFMSARDIAYVVHAILKPVLAEGVSENDYHMQFLRRSGSQANPANPKDPRDMNEEMLSRAKKSKEWSTDKSTLGHVAKTNVARPRALIATPQSSSEQDSEQKQRASVWKARVYCDQAYQAYQVIMDTWRAAPPGSKPPQFLTHLMKLMKCMGITSNDGQYKIDEEALRLLAKLSKGRTLIARILEQELLPANAVQPFLPILLGIIFPLNTKKGEAQGQNDVSTERCFRAITRVLKKLNTPSFVLLKCIEVVHQNGKAALSSTSRMECVHTLLQKGSFVIGQDPSEENRAAWGKAESDFMVLLQA